MYGLFGTLGECVLEISEKASRFHTDIEFQIIKNNIGIFKSGKSSTKKLQLIGLA